MDAERRLFHSRVLKSSSPRRRQVQWHNTTSSATSPLPGVFLQKTPPDSTNCSSSKKPQETSLEVPAQITCFLSLLRPHILSTDQARCYMGKGPCMLEEARALYLNPGS